MSTSYEFYHDDVTVTSFINISLDIATLPLKSSHKEQPSAVRLLWTKGLGANAIQSEMRPVYLTSILQDQQYAWCKKFAHGRESVADEE